MNTKTVTDKDILLKIKENLIKQGKPSYKTFENEDDGELYEEVGSCAYYNDFGNRCAVGQLIDKEFYTYEIEDRPASSSEVIAIVGESNPDWKMDVASVLMLGLAQRVHDIHFHVLTPLYEVMEKYFDENGKFNFIEYREESGNWFIASHIYPKVVELQSDITKDFATGYDYRSPLKTESNNFISTEYYVSFLKIMEDLV